MASERQSTQTEKTSESASPLSHSASQNSLMEGDSAQSHLNDVRAPELVYNIDEETRMGPETTNDGVTPPSRETAVREPKGKIVEAKPAPKEQSSTPAPTAATATPFSALSFIASQYAESDNSSPRSADSPAGFQEDNGGTSLVPPHPPPEVASGHSSDGFETSSIMPTPQAASPGEPTPAPAAQAEEGKAGVEKMGAGGDAPAPCVAPAETEKTMDERPDMDREVGQDGDAKKDEDQSQLMSGEPDLKETGLDKGADANTDVSDVKMDREVKIEAGGNKDAVDVDMGEGGVNKDAVDVDMGEGDVNKDAVDVDMGEGDVNKDADAPSGEEKVREKVEPEDKPAAEPVTTRVTEDVTDHVSEGVREDVGTAVSNEGVRQQPTLFGLPADGAMSSSLPEPMDTAEPMETEHSTEQQGEVMIEHSTELQGEVMIEHSTEQQGEAEDKMLTEHTDLVGEKDREEPVQPVTDTPEGPKLVPDTEPVKPSEGKQLPDTDSVMSEDSKLDLEVAPTADSVMGDDSRPAPSADYAVPDSARLGSKLHSVVSASNMDCSVMSDDSRLASNMDSVMSEDSKLMNLDSMMSSGLDESSTSFALKGPSAVVPFGENANSSMPLMAMGMEGENSNFSFVDESSQSNSMVEKPSRPKRPRRSSISDIQDSKLETEDGLHPFPAERVFEYQWPQDGGEWYLLQEQVSEYLGVLSFKRKYPDLTRRTCDKLEKDFLREKGVVTETQSDLGLTAIRSEEVYDLMMKDYPDKYHEYATLLHEREKQKISDKNKEYEVAQPKLEKSKMADYMKKAAKSAAEYNRHLLREKREERLAFFDLQTFMIQYPEGRYKKLPPEVTKPSAYPVALIPGQFQDHYCSYTSDELRYFPLNTALYDPPKRMSNTLAKPAGSSESSDDSEDKSGSSSDSSGSSGSGSSDSETPAAAAASAAEGNNTADTLQPPATPSSSTPADAAVATTGKKSAKKGGKAGAAAGTKTPGRSPGRPVKGKRKLETGGGEVKKEGSATAGGDAAATATTPVPSAAGPASSPAPNKDKTEDDEDKDKCRICKNAVLFLKYKRVETKMIKCSECGKIAHPTCLDLTDKMVQVVTTYPWQCMECKTCVECMDPYDEDKMLFCDRCDRGYHTFCVGLRCLPTGRWECRSCKGVAETQKSRRGRPIKPT